VCLGAEARAQNEAARRQYNYELRRRERNWNQSLSIYGAKSVQYDINTSAADMGIAQAYADEQEQKRQARGDAAIKYEEMFRKLAQNSEYSQILASGGTGRSAARIGRMESAALGRKVSEMTRELTLNDRKLDRATAQTVGKMQGYKQEQFAQVAFQPIPGVAPPQPVMRNVGAAAFMDALSIGGQVAGIVSAFSDRRLKENIKKIGESISGLGIYTFNYIGKATKYIGTMADEVLKVKAEAVTIRDGYMAVNYGLIDVNFEVA
jgi:hypothetical protein